jgi:hypothetical protein
MSISAIPLNISLTAGPTPTAPADLDAALIAAVAAEVPDYTANLPGSLIEDISSTDVGALVTIDQARVDAINSVSPYSANPYILAQQGGMYGIPQGQPTNTSVDVVFSGTVGYVIPSGFIVGDGAYQYVTQDAGVIGSAGTSLSIYAVASQSGSWTPLQDSVNQIISAVDVDYTLTVTNPVAGAAGGPAETVESYRSRVLQAGQASAQGITSMLKTALQAVSGVLANLVSVVQVGTALKVICGGGDPYQIALAIFKSTINWPNLVISGSIASATVTNGGSGFTSAPAVAFTAAPSGGTTATGTAVLSGSSVASVTITNPGSGYITMPIVSFSGGAGSGAAATANSRNVSASIVEAPNTYTLTWVNPPAQVVTCSVIWNTTIPSFAGGSQVNQLAQAALLSYLNSIPVGQPINLLQMTSVFQTTVSSILTLSQIETLTFAVTINGTAVSPEAGTSLIVGDSESYFTAAANAVTVAQG